ncbi:MAG: VWA domain-containing protein [Eubacterium sp.]|nr:VWA domain-containing protein [Eubacterium sp.]
MTFGTLIPLIFLVGVPVIIIIYLMKPKGTPKVIPSLLLWKNAERNEKSMTFSKKLIKNILMFLEIAALILLMFATMSPAIKRGGSEKAESSLIVIDTSGSMNYKADGTKTRFDLALRDALDYVEMTSGDISVLSSGAENKVLINTSRDKLRIKKLISGLECTDAAGRPDGAEGLIESVGAEKVIVFTDSEGKAALEDISSRISMDIYVYGERTDNIALSQMSMKKNDNGLFDISVNYSVFGEHAASFDISVLDSGNNLLGIRTIDAQAGTNGSILLTDKNVRGGYAKAVLSAVSFDDKSGDKTADGLDNDNTAYAVAAEKAQYDAYLIGNGNIYVEKAFKAATGENVIKNASDSDIISGDKKTVAIYDDPTFITSDTSRLIFNYPKDIAADENGHLVRVRQEPFLKNLSEFTFGAGGLKYLTVPEWGKPLMTIDDADVGERVVAYYGEHDGIREVILGFDIRNSEFPLMAEFPVFIADAMTYLADDSLISEHYIMAGTDGPAGETENRAGLYEMEGEHYVVRFPLSESEGGAVEAVSVKTGNEDYGIRYSPLRRLCLVIALILIIIDLVIYYRRNRVYRGLPLILRALLILTVTLAIIGINLPGRKKGNATIFVVDMSDSNIDTLPEKEDYLRNLISGMPRGDAFGIVTFGANAMTDQFVNSEARYLGIATAPKGRGTDIEGAIEYAAALLPEDRFGRIMLLTDGCETIGDVNETYGTITRGDIELCLKLFEGELGNDTYIQSVDMPDKLSVGDTYRIKVTVFSNYDTDAVLKLWDSSKVVSESSVSLVKGENTFVLDGVAGDDGIEEKHVTIEAPGDTVEENNSMVAAALVDAPKKVLIISGLSEDSSGFSDMISGLNVNLSTVSAINAPETITDLLQYKTIIIDNAHISDLPEGFVNSIESYVKDYGGGLITTGGRESYGPGGYKDTVLEKILPVDMTPKAVNEKPSLAMVMVIDCSGSMDSPVEGYGASGKPKIDVAVDAAIEAVETMDENDMVGVLTFSDTNQWRQKIVKLDDKDAVIDQIKKIGIEGGTVIKPAVKSAANALMDVDAGVKHILLLTDGEGETREFSDAIELINDNYITMSTIAVGSDSDTQLLEHLADECGGRYYFSESSSDVPKIFTEEVYLSAGTYYKHGDFTISMNSSNQLVDGLYPDGLPHIEAYIATSAKSGAREIMATDEDDPLLASWQYGLGNAISWMSNGSGTWDANLVGMDDYAAMWKRMLDMASMDGDVGNDSMNINRRRGKLLVDYHALEYSEDTELKGVYTSPTGESGELKLLSDEPGNYTAEFDADEPGVYSISVRRMEDGETAAAVTGVQAVQFSDEYRKDISNEGLVSFVTENGRIIKDGDKVFTKLKGKKNNKRNITFILIVLSIILLILDIIARRFGIQEKLITLWKKIRPERAEKKKPVKKAGKKDIAKPISEAEDGWIEAGETDSPGAAQEYTNTLEAPQKEKPGKTKKQVKKPAESPAETALDTAALLKKKKDRNL